MFQFHPWSNVILHLDGDAFFASVIQAAYPHLKGKPVAVGKERGIATAISYEAKKFGIKRGMIGTDIKKLCPHCNFITSDYELYALFSEKMFNILRSFSPDVEEYSVDEGFADLKGLRRPLNSSYTQIAKNIKNKVQSSLGISVSVGVATTKSLAKLASDFKKPGGLTVINGLNIKNFLKQISLNKIWGIGINTTSYLQKLGLKTALDFALKEEDFIKKHLTKPYFEIWQELRGKKVYEINTQGKTSYKGIVKSQTFKPNCNNPKILWAKLSHHLEQAFQKARRFNYQAGKITIFLKTQNFRYHTTTIKLLQKTGYPLLIRKELKQGFNKIFQKQTYYRACGCQITDFEDLHTGQLSFFSNKTKEKKAKKIYPVYEDKKIDFGTSLYDKKIKQSKTKANFSLPVVSITNL
ncbi:DNA polymerase IV [Patescibacteria group bacterium]